MSGVSIDSGLGWNPAEKVLTVSMYRWDTGALTWVKVSGGTTTGPDVNVTNFPASQAISGTVTSNQGTANATPWNENIAQVGGVTISATAKGTQGTNFVPIQNAKDSGRTFLSLTLDRVAGVTSEALATMAINKGGTTSSATTYTVTTGKTLRIQAMFFACLPSSTTAPFGRVRLRAVNGTVTVSSPIIITLDSGNPLASATTVAGGGSDGAEIFSIPDGLEIPSAWQIGISQIMNATTTTVSVTLIGYEY